MSRVTRSSNDNPMAAMPLARIHRQLAVHGNIRTSKSGMKCSGHSSAASPNARPSWTTMHDTKVFTVRIPMRGVVLNWNVSEALSGSYEGYIAGWHATLACSTDAWHVRDQNRSLTLRLGAATGQPAFALVPCAFGSLFVHLAEDFRQELPLWRVWLHCWSSRYFSK
jgi:hypothetical protein